MIVTCSIVIDTCFNWRCGQGEFLISIMERMEYLNVYTGEYIDKLCLLNNVDTSQAKLKSEKISLLCKLPKMEESDGHEKNQKHGSEPLMELIKEFKRMNDVNMNYCKYFSDCTTNNNLKIKGLQKFSAEDDIECYLDTFRRMATVQGKPESIWTSILEPMLSGKAQQAYYMLTAEEKMNFELVTDTILRAYELTPDNHRIKFTSNPKGYQETFEEYGHKLMLYFRRWAQMPK